MLIKTLKQYSCCLAEYHNGEYEIAEYCVDDFHFDYDTKNYVEYLRKNDMCVTKSVKDGEKFFFTLKRFYKRKEVDSSSYIGFLKTQNEKKLLVTEKLVSGNGISPEENQKFLIYPYFPEQNFFNSQFSRSILTSDGVVCLEDDQFIGVRDGLIEELDVQEVLEIISKGKTETSPLFSSLRLNPVTKRPARPRKGTLIYNKNNDKIEVYNGQEWIEL